MRAIIVDDEENIRNMIRQILADDCPQVELVGEAGGVEAAASLIKDLKPDLVLLDIRLEDGTAFDLLDRFERKDFRVIFITAFEEYALKAFKMSAVDYILKPVDADELATAIEKADQLILSQLDRQLQILFANLNDSSRNRKKIVLKTLEKIYFIGTSDIIYCESDSSYTFFHLLDGQRLVVSKALKEYEEMLNDFGFYRPHKSFLVNMGHIQAFDKADGGYIIMRGDARIPVSSRKRDDFLKMVDGMWNEG